MPSSRDASTCASSYLALASAAVMASAPATNRAGARRGGWWVAVAAHYAGFYLVNSIEVDARAGVTAGDVARLWSLAVRTDAEAVFVLGLDDGRAVLDPMADELSGLARKFAGGRDHAARSLRQLRRRPRHRSRPPYLNDPPREPDPRRTSRRDH